MDTRPSSTETSIDYVRARQTMDSTAPTSVTTPARKAEEVGVGVAATVGNGVPNGVAADGEEVVGFVVGVLVGLAVLAWHEFGSVNGSTVLGTLYPGGRRIEVKGARMPKKQNIVVWPWFPEGGVPKKVNSVSRFDLDELGWLPNEMTSS